MIRNDIVTADVNCMPFAQSRPLCFSCSEYSGLESEEDDDNDDDDNTPNGHDNDAKSKNKSVKSKKDKKSKEDSKQKYTKQVLKDFDDAVEATKKAGVEVVDEYADYDSSDEEEIRNTVGNIPMEWYKDYEHIGYDLDGKKIMKSQQMDELDEFLDKMDNPDYWRTVRDKLTGKRG